MGARARGSRSSSTTHVALRQRGQRVELHARGRDGWRGRRLRASRTEWGGKRGREPSNNQVQVTQVSKLSHNLARNISWIRHLDSDRTGTSHSHGMIVITWYYLSRSKRSSSEPFARKVFAHALVARGRAAERGLLLAAGVRRLPLAPGVEVRAARPRNCPTSWRASAGRPASRPAPPAPGLAPGLAPCRGSCAWEQVGQAPAARPRRSW